LPIFCKPTKQQVKHSFIMVGTVAFPVSAANDRAETSNGGIEATRLGDKYDRLQSR
jgi:hypothetical protein